MTSSVQLQNVAFPYRPLAKARQVADAGDYVLAPGGVGDFFFVVSGSSVSLHVANEDGDDWVTKEIGVQVTGADMDFPDDLFVASGSDPVTINKVNQAANKVYAGPGTGAETAPTFRLLVEDDLPVLSINPSGEYTNADITVDAWGRVIAASNGDPGEGGGDYTPLLSRVYLYDPLVDPSGDIILWDNEIVDVLNGFDFPSGDKTRFTNTDGVSHTYRISLGWSMSFTLSSGVASGLTLISTAIQLYKNGTTVVHSHDILLLMQDGTSYTNPESGFFTVELTLAASDYIVVRKFGFGGVDVTFDGGGANSKKTWMTVEQIA